MQESPTSPRSLSIEPQCGPSLPATSPSCLSVLTYSILPQPEPIQSTPRASSSDLCENNNSIIHKVNFETLGQSPSWFKNTYQIDQFQQCIFQKDYSRNNENLQITKSDTSYKPTTSQRKSVVLSRTADFGGQSITNILDLQNVQLSIKPELWEQQIYEKSSTTEKADQVKVFSPNPGKKEVYRDLNGIKSAHRKNKSKRHLRNNRRRKLEFSTNRTADSKEKRYIPRIVH